MDIPRGHAMIPLSMLDFYDFIFNYFKAEYAPIRSFFSTASAEPRQPDRWVNMGHELAPLVFRPANAQAQKDLATLDHFIREKGLDPWFMKGLVIRFAKYDGHDRLERKLYEACRVDLMVRKALKEKHLLDALWPSPPARTVDQDFIQQGVKVRVYYGDMFGKYFQYLHSVDDFGLKPDVDEKMKRNGQLNLVPFADHIDFGDVPAIVPIVAKGTGYNYSQRSAGKKRSGKEELGKGYGDPDRFEIRFDAPTSITDTLVKTVARQTSCLKCGARRDVTVLISMDPAPEPTSQELPASSPLAQISKSTKPNTPARRHSKASRRYSPGYAFPARENTSDPVVTPVSPPASTHDSGAQPGQAPPTRMKQCLRCTFLNHPELTQCEMCNGDLPESTLVSPPPSPKSVAQPDLVNQSPPETNAQPKMSPPPANRHSLSSTLFSIFPFSQEPAEGQSQPGQKQKTPPFLPPQSRPNTAPGSTPDRPNTKKRVQFEEEYIASPSTAEVKDTSRSNRPPPLIDVSPDLDQPPQMSLMPLTSPDPQPQFAHFEGLPQHLMDDYVPVSPALQHEEEDAGWGEMSREEARAKDDDDEDDEERERIRRGFVELDVVNEERGVWGD